MTVTVYRSTDSGAPVLNGVAGSLVALLDAVLVNGYGSKPAVGWTKAFSATNKAAYKQPVGTNGLYLYVDDSATLTTANYARLRGYESMSSISSGVAGFPTDFQVSGGLYTTKSSAADATARPWTVYSNGKIIYVMIDQANSGTYVSSIGFAFGDISSVKTGDMFGTILIASASNSFSNTYYQLSGVCTSPLSTLAGHYFCRPHTQIGGSTPGGKLIDGKGGSVSYIGNTNGTSVPFPNPADGGLYVSPVWLTDSYSFRGVLPGVWAPMQAIGTLPQGDQISGTGPYLGKTFEVCYTYANNGSVLPMLFEVSNTW